MTDKYPAKPIPFTFINIQNQLEAAFALWNIKNPSTGTQILRSFYFLSALIITIFWPIQDLLINFIMVTICWLMASLSSKTAPRFLLLLLIMLTITFLFHGIQILTDMYQKFLIWIL